MKGQVLIEEANNATEIGQFSTGAGPPHTSGHPPAA